MSYHIMYEYGSKGQRICVENLLHQTRSDINLTVILAIIHLIYGCPYYIMELFNRLHSQDSAGHHESYQLPVSSSTPTFPWYSTLAIMFQWTSFCPRRQVLKSTPRLTTCLILMLKQRPSLSSNIAT